MKNRINIFILSGWIFGILVFITGVLNIFLVHPVPGIIYLLLSAIYFPPVNEIITSRSGLHIPMVLKIALGVFILMFTLGVSDLGDIIDNYF